MTDNFLGVYKKPLLSTTTVLLFSFSLLSLFLPPSLPSFRTIAPIFAGSVFAASLSPSTLAIGFPFNYNLIFVLFGVVFLSTVFLATCLPSSLNKQKIIEDATDDDDDDDPEVKGEDTEPEVKGEGASSLPSDDCEASMETAI